MGIRDVTGIDPSKVATITISMSGANTPTSWNPHTQVFNAGHLYMTMYDAQGNRIGNYIQAGQDPNGELNFAQFAQTSTINDPLSYTLNLPNVQQFTQNVVNAVDLYADAIRTQRDYVGYQPYPVSSYDAELESNTYLAGAMLAGGMHWSHPEHRRPIAREQ